MLTACVTGADHGLGLALVRKLLLEGYRVIAGRYADHSPGLEQLEAAYADRLLVTTLDIGSDESVKQAVQAAKEFTPFVDILINNAGVLGDIDTGLGESLDFNDMQQVYNINALGPLRVVNGLLGLLQEGDAPLVINISSEAGSISQAARDRWFAYGMSKAALNMQSKLVYNALHGDVDVWVIHPGWMKTMMRGKVDDAADLTPEQSAEAIFCFIDNRTHETLEQKGGEIRYFDIEGQDLPW
ncbi:SDR family NAD(P)-dependent oxidoreductase [Paenibacillus lemnae]|uniref:SDR family NAD(P)-dependent oxidoreductase n=1 Tax=Paenibacillus lemnae TaxID=1330551 RepID=A0A848M169_PAELE|nr:SDR family NAD(P)-dependent oxidoreductase [Paenibacillus lemnae]NMO94505.1 SDR family NAD(P)-dependent oxidoreductase [Paenibacillus lemnae]